MAKTPERDGKHWTTGEIQKLRELAKGNTPTRVAAIKLDRSPGAVYAKAQEKGIGLKPTNQSPYGTAKKKR